MNKLFVFDKYDKPLCEFFNDVDSQNFFVDAIYERRLTGESFFTFKVKGDIELSRHIKEQNQVGFFCRDSRFRLFKIKKTREGTDQRGNFIQVTCQASILELLKNIIDSTNLTNQSLSGFLSVALQGTRYQVGNTAPLGTKTYNLSKMNSIELLNKIVELFGCEIDERIEVNNGQISRFIDLPARLGADTGKTLEITKDIIRMAKTTSIAHIATALYGEGATIQSDDDEVKRLDFANVEWSIANGNPLDKPLGQTYLEDTEATALFGLPHNGQTLPLEGKSTHHSIREPEELLLATYHDLQQRTQPFYNFEMDIFLLGDLTGYEAHKIRLGDTVRTVNREFTCPILVESRIIMYRYDVANPSAIAEIELGHHLNLYGDRLDRIEQEIGQIGSRPTPPVTDESISPVPLPIQNLTARGLFRTVNVTWDNQRLGINFELHGSQVMGFTPSTANLIYRGTANGFNHSDNVNVDQQWYYRVRSINVRGEVGPWSEEVVANTARITGDFIEELTIGDAHIGSVGVDKLVGGVGKFVDLQGATISGSIIQTIAPNQSIRIHQGLVEVNDTFGTVSARLSQNSLIFNDRHNNQATMGSIGRLHTAGDVTDAIGVHLSAQVGYDSRMTSINPLTGLFSTQINVPGGGVGLGARTTIHRLDLGTTMNTLNSNIQTDVGNTLSFTGDGDVLFGVGKTVGMRTLRTTGFGENVNIEFGSFAMGGTQGFMIANQIPNPQFGFFIGPNHIGAISNGIAQNWDITNAGFGVGTINIGQRRETWGRWAVPDGTGNATHTTSGTYGGIMFSNAPHFSATVIADVGANVPNPPTVTLMQLTNTTWQMRVHRNGFGGAISVQWKATGRRSTLN